MNVRRLFLHFHLVIFLLLVTNDTGFGQDFEAEFEGMIGEFAGSLDESSAVEALMGRADDLYDRVRQYRRDNRDDLPDEESDRLRDLYQQVRSFKAVARVVGQAHNAAYVSIEGFDRVSERLALEPRVLQTLDSGLELVRIDVGSFGSLLLRNTTKTTFSVMYGVNDPERPGGVGSASCESYSVMSGLFNSRDREIEGLEFTIDTRDVQVSGCD